MTPKTAQVFALIVAAQARIEGMKADNAQRTARGLDNPAYTEFDFYAEASQLEQLAVEVINQ